MENTNVLRAVNHIVKSYKINMKCKDVTQIMGHTQSKGNITQIFGLHYVVTLMSVSVTHIFACAKYR